MALFTTTPARLITPTPVMMIPNGVWVIIRPAKTPIFPIGFIIENNVAAKLNKAASDNICTPVRMGGTY